MAKMKFQKQIMSRLIILVTLGWIILCPVSASAEQAGTLFALANKAYADGRYQQAVELYEQILQKRLASGEVYFNLGNAYYKLNQIGKAILYYEKAEVYLSGDEALEQNLKIARLKIVDKIEPLPVLFLTEWWNTAINAFAFTTIAWLCFGFFGLTLFWLAIYLLVNRRIFVRLAWIAAAVFIILLVMFIGKIYQFESSQYGIIFADKISVVGEPTLTGQELFILHEGTKVKINRSLDGWYEISLADGKTGWIKADALEII